MILRVVLFSEYSKKRMPESSKGVKFEPLKHQKQIQGLKFDTLGGSRCMTSVGER